MLEELDKRATNEINSFKSKIHQLLADVSSNNLNQIPQNDKV